MRIKKLIRAASFVAVAGLLLVTASSPVMAQQLPERSDRQLETEVQDLRTFMNSVPEGDFRDKRDKKELRSDFDDTFRNDWYRWGWGKHKYSEWKTCKTVYQLTYMLDKIERMRERKPNASLEELYTRLWMLRNDLLLSMPADQRCRGFDYMNQDTQVRVGTSDNKQVALDVTFPVPTLTTERGNGQTFTRVHINGIENMVGKPGEPALPMWRQLVALPEGSTPMIKMSETKKSNDLLLNLVPFQEQPVDQTAPGEQPGTADPGNETTPPEPDMDTFADKPFVINKRAYETNRTLPAEPCKVTPMGQYRDVQMAQLECATGSYNPVTDKYQMYSGMHVEVQFEGGNGNFITSRTFNEFEGAAKLTTESVVNKSALSKYVKEFDLSNLQCSGEEFLILTHSNFREAADELAEHKRNRGMTTNVFNVGSGVASRDTAQEIDKFIENRYDDCKVRPSYVLLLGDAEFIPTFYPSNMPENTGSDFPYSNYVQILFDAFFPDFGTGRIPVDTLAQANTVVDKIMNYESNPPHMGLGNGAPYYTTAGFASQFQGFRMNPNGTPLNNQPGTDQRAFIETSELARQELVDRGYTVPRIYTRTIDNGGYCLQENENGDCIQTQAAYNGNTTPRRYFNGNLLPAAIGAGSGFAWDGDTADVTNAWNDGRFLFLHRDHGWPGGWGDPGFSTTNVNALSNGDRLPVVWSVNCASGIFDNETANGIYGTSNGSISFAEAALRKADGGAIGIIGDTRNSPTWANNALTRGFFDAVWPDTVPGFGGNTSHKRLGDTLNWGKVYLATQVGVEQTAGSVSVDSMAFEYHIWGVTGDPTLSMWTSNPRRITLDPNFKVLETTPLHSVLDYKAPNGTVVTHLQLTREGESKAIARGEVQNNKVMLKYFEQPSDAYESVYAASKADTISVQLSEQKEEIPPRVE
jgi:hypothetical protein